MCFALQQRAIFRHRNFKKWSDTVSFLTFWLRHVLLATDACNFLTSELQKALRSWCVWYILRTWKCASRHSGVRFFDVSSTKSAAKLTCFVHFHLKMCFSPQRRAIVRRLKCKKCSGPDVFCTCSLENVLLATAACNFRRFNEPTFRLTRQTNHWKTQATSLTFGVGVSSFF